MALWHAHTHTHHRIYASRSNLKYEEVKRVFGDNGLSVCKMWGHLGVNSIALLNILLLFLLSFTGCPTVLENSIEYSIAQLNWPPGKLSRYCNKYKTFCVMVSHKLNPWNVLQHVRTNCMNWLISSQCQKQPIYSRQLILWLPRDKAIIVFVAKG